MDPLNKLEKYENKVKRIITNLYLKYFLQKYKVCKVAGGTSKYIVLAHKIPFYMYIEMMLRNY